MSATICLELERNENALKLGAWKKTSILRTYLYPDDVEHFVEIISNNKETAYTESGEESDTVHADNYQKFLNQLDEETLALFPTAPVKWQTAEATIEILW